MYNIALIKRRKLVFSLRPSDSAAVLLINPDSPILVYSNLAVSCLQWSKKHENSHGAPWLD